MTREYRASFLCVGEWRRSKGLGQVLVDLVNILSFRWRVETFWDREMNKDQSWRQHL